MPFIKWIKKIIDDNAPLDKDYNLEFQIEIIIF